MISRGCPTCKGRKKSGFTKSGSKWLPCPTCRDSDRVNQGRICVLSVEELREIAIGLKDSALIVCYDCAQIGIGAQKRDKAEARGALLLELAEALIKPGNKTDWKRSNLQHGIDAADKEEILVALKSLLEGGKV